MSKSSITVLKESKSTKPLGILRIDGSLAKPGETVLEEHVRGGAEACERYLAEKPCRVKKGKGVK